MDRLLRRRAQGLGALVFAGGIGENGPPVRARVCEGLGFLGIALHESRNAETAGVISTDASRVAVRVIRTDEEQMIAGSVCRVLGLDVVGEKGVPTMRRNTSLGGIHSRRAGGPHNPR